MVDPGEGYRLLEDGELLRYDDEFHTGAKYWVGVDFTAWGGRYRRKIEMNEINYTFEGVRPLIRYGGSVWRQLAVGEVRQEGDIHRMVCQLMGDSHYTVYRRIDTVCANGYVFYRPIHETPTKPENCGDAADYIAHLEAQIAKTK